MGKSSIYDEDLAAMLEGMARLVCLRGYTTHCHICPKLADLLLHLFRVGLVIVLKSGVGSQMMTKISSVS